LTPLSYFSSCSRFRWSSSSLPRSNHRCINYVDPSFPFFHPSCLHHSTCTFAQPQIPGVPRRATINDPSALLKAMRDRNQAAEMEAESRPVIRSSHAEAKVCIFSSSKRLLVDCSLPARHSCDRRVHHARLEACAGAARQGPHVNISHHVPRAALIVNILSLQSTCIEHSFSMLNKL
jgi:hypothetical protein